MVVWVEQVEFKLCTAEILLIAVTLPAAVVFRTMECRHDNYVSYRLLCSVQMLMLPLVPCCSWASNLSNHM